MPSPGGAASVLYLQDVLDAGRRPGSLDPAEAFFELANVPWAGYRLPPPEGDDDADGGGHAERRRMSSPSDRAVVVRQDGEARSHTGGIVWETSYLLANFLLGRFGLSRRGEKNAKESDETMKKRPLGRVLEVGSGRGLLGLALAASGLCTKVVLTECEEVLNDMKGNVDRNIRRSHKKKKTDTNANASDEKAQPEWRRCVSSKRASARQLQWDRLEEDVALGGDDLRPHSFDTIVGTDVVFTPKLVEPLLRTLAKMSHGTTEIYLCLQVRCADSHQMLLEKAGEHGFRVKDASDEFRDVPGCQWGEELECKVLRLVPVETDGTNIKKRSLDAPERKDKKKRKKKKQRETLCCSHF